jgi:hypothetical protein
MAARFALALLCTLAIATPIAAQTRFLGLITVPFPTFLSVFNHTEEPSSVRRYTILAASFNPTRSTYDSTYALYQPGVYVNGDVAATPVKTVFNFLYGPNEVQQVPASVFGHDAIIHFDGTRIFDKTRGAIYVSDVTDISFPATYDISSDITPGAWIYTTAIWKMVNDDVRMDLLACRIQFQEDQIAFAQLVSLTHPFQGISTNWNINVLKDAACDGRMAEARLRVNGLRAYDVIYTVGQYTKRLTFFWTASPNEQWNNADDILGGVIETGREYYDVITGDFNLDGNIDVLVTVTANTGGTVEIFEIPNDFRQETQYTKHVIATGFIARHNGAEGRTPGVARLFYPDQNHERKPWIYVAGADDGRAYFLVPDSESTSDWTYNQVTVVDQGADEHVGGMTAADVDGDGYQELFVSVQTRDRVEVYTFKP